jgi:hypothetical protein
VKLRVAGFADRIDEARRRVPDHRLQAVAVPEVRREDGDRRQEGPYYQPPLYFLSRKKS